MPMRWLKATNTTMMRENEKKSSKNVFHLEPPCECRSSSCWHDGNDWLRSQRKASVHSGRSLFRQSRSESIESLTRTAAFTCSDVKIKSMKFSCNEPLEHENTFFSHTEVDCFSSSTSKAENNRSLWVSARQRFFHPKILCECVRVFPSLAPKLDACSFA